MKALLSVFDKRGIVDFAKKLKELDCEIISTGGTYKCLSEEGISVTKISDFTGSPEILGGRVKTLHPKIFAGILAREDQQEELEENNLTRLDIVCCNLYPFEETVKKGADEKEVLENIDIGGVTLLRAAAKNYENVIILTDPDDYNHVIDEIASGGEISRETRKKLALKAFKTTAHYDNMISRYFSGTQDLDEINISLKKVMDLRYGENSQQKAAVYGDLPFEKIQGEKELSFNNLQDLNGAVNIVKSFNEPAVAIIKHAVPCGAASCSNFYDSYMKALESDSLSAFGGIVGLNGRLEKDVAEEIVKHFYEVVVAPEFSAESLEVLAQKKNLRVVRYMPFEDDLDMRRIPGGLLIQHPDSFEGENWKVVTDRQPSEEEMADMKFAWNVVRFLKSNAIALVKGRQTYGLGSGETSRVGAVEVAKSKVTKFFGDDKGELVMASDAFFPFPDGIESAAEAGVTVVVQPGGSVRDEEVIKKADELGICMVFTGRRHFLH
jgi:phosphoribosylaminoimidazolecarboxamide formyltransferase/IMP cyclohydrolase